jgi:transposase-like protein
MEHIETTATQKLFSLDQVAAAFGADFLDAGRCASFVLEQLHGEGARCPQCGAELQGQKRETFRSWGRVHCSECGKWFSATTGTPLHKSKIDVRQLILISMLLSEGITVRRIAEMTELSAATIASWWLKFQAFAPHKGSA